VTREMIILKFPTLLLLVAAVLLPLGCAKKLDGDTSFRAASKGFEKELPGEKRKQTIKELQAETDTAGERTNDRTVTPLPSQVVTPVNPPPPSQPMSLKPPIHPSPQ
jgi:hypothetical protein